ncbi:sodium:solute symporter family transporter [Siminovitchia acidinfaciens]|nr:hypothetical protein [Siminovitchia acidinfaciens]
MQLNPIGGFAVLIISAIVMIPLAIWFNQKGSKTSDDFMTARESVSNIMAMASLMATWIWASTLLGSAEGGYQFGATALWTYAAILPISAVIGIPVIKRARQMMPNASTFPEIVGKRIGSKGHAIFTFVAIAQMFFFGVVNIMAVGLILNAMFGMSHWQTVIIAGAIITIYIAIGGVRAAIITGSVQVVAMVILLILIMPITIFKVGGPSAIYQGLAASGVPTATTIISKDTVTGWLLISWGGYIMYTFINSEVWQKVFAVKQGEESKLILGSTLLWVPIPCVAGIIGMIGLAQGLNLQGSEVMPAVFLKLMPPWVTYFVVVILLASIFSTVSTCLSACSTIFVNDIFKPLQKKLLSLQGYNDKQVLRLAKVSVLFFGLLMTFIGTGNFSILFFTYAIGALAVPITWPFVISILMKRINTRAIFLGMIIGILASIYFVFLPEIGAIENPVPLWQGYWITHAISGVIPLIGCLLWPKNEEPQQLETRVI